MKMMVLLGFHPVSSFFPRTRATSNIWELEISFDGKLFAPLFKNYYFVLYLSCSRVWVHRPEAPGVPVVSQDDVPGFPRE